MSEHDPAAERGFTLIELLIALVLLVIVSLVLLQILQTTIRTSQSSSLSAQESTPENVRLFLRNALEQAVIPHATRISQTEPNAFYGRPHEIEFVSQYTVLGQIGGLYRYQVRLEPINSGSTANRLILQWSRHSLNRLKQKQKWRQEILLDDVRSLAFKYLGTVEKDKNIGWIDHWPNNARLPNVVFITIKTSSHRGHLEPPLVVRVETADQMHFR